MKTKWIFHHEGEPLIPAWPTFCLDLCHTPAKAIWFLSGRRELWILKRRSLRYVHKGILRNYSRLMECSAQSCFRVLNKMHSYAIRANVHLIVCLSGFYIPDIKHEIWSKYIFIYYENCGSYCNNCILNSRSTNNKYCNIFFWRKYKYTCCWTNVYIKFQNGLLNSLKNIYLWN